LLKAPGSKHMKLKYDEPPSNFAFKMILRRYMKVCEKVESKQTTTYNEVADELVAEFSNPDSDNFQAGPHTPSHFPFQLRLLNCLEPVCPCIL